jgi:hypothetical protein
MDFLESALRSSLLKDGAHLLGDLLNDPLYKGRQEALPGEKCYRDRAKTVETLFGGDPAFARLLHGGRWRKPRSAGRKPRPH